jgi:hypothetical protein
MRNVDLIQIQQYYETLVSLWGVTGLKKEVKVNMVDVFSIQE